MEYSEFIGLVQQGSGGLGTEAAERATEATLAERLPGGEVRRIALELPPPQLMPWLHTESGAVAFGIDEFLDRVANREGTDVEIALQHARGVFFAFGSALSPESVAHLATLLPRTYAPLVDEAEHRYLEIMPAEAVTSKEWFDVIVELPADYQGLIPAGPARG